ncbi:MAG TPA: polysaccharide biosynthesis tyrosine autokinase [Acidobacteriaceae bacterium]|nr:polysaccharide biosynthesis tyrosine autokinase [Acidobacteriaceae bacterium]
MTNQLMAPHTIEGQRAPQGTTLLDLWRIVRRRQLIVFGVLVAALTCAALVSVFSTRRYEATGEIQVQKDSSDALGLDSLMGAAGGSPTDALDANVTLQTQAKILESQTLALKVVDHLHLVDAPDFQRHFSVIGWALGLIAAKGAPDAANNSLENSPNKRDHVLRIFQSNTKVIPVPGTRLIDVSYMSTDPKLAAATVNQLIDSLIDYNFQTRYLATAQASEWLSKQLTDLRTRSENLQAQVAELQRQSGVFSFGGQDVDGKGVAYSTVLDQLQQTTVMLSAAQSNRIIKGALYQATKTNDADTIAGLSGSPLLAGASPGVGTSLALIQTLRSQEATQRGQISEAATKFGPAYSKLGEMRANLASMQQSIRDEQGRLQKQTRNDAQVSQDVEDHIRSVFDQQKKSAEALNNKAIQYQLLRQEADQSSGLYERLLSRLKEAGVLEGLKSSNITIVEPGRVASRPAKPSIELLFAAAVAAGLFLGLLAAFGLEIMDSKVHDLQVVSMRFGDAFFGDLPFEREKIVAPRLLPGGGSTAISAVAKPSSPYSESLRALRTAILLARGGSPPKVLLVTSSIAQEGKSTLSANLAAMLAQQGKQVLLVDADLRRPTLHARFRLSNSVGLSSLLTTEGTMQSDGAAFQKIEEIPGLQIITAGPVPPYPAELLGSEQMRTLVEEWREKFDFIVLDAAPVLPVTDSVMVAPLADQILLVARHGVTESSALDRSFGLLQSRTGDIPIGIVINAVKRTADSYYGAYGSYRYGPVNGRKGQAVHV